MKVLGRCSHISSLQVVLYGRGMRCPCSRVCMTVRGVVPGYGVFPPLNISHIVTPYDHCEIYERNEGHVSK